jgi:predicted nucleic-acid-binding protein
MKVTADTNVLIRIIMDDDEAQARAAVKLLSEAELVAISTPCLCEVAWVLARTYRLAGKRIAVAIRSLIDAGNVATNRSVVEAGLALLEAGGDFADGVMAHEGQWLGGDIFVSFDKKAVTLLAKQGEAARLLAAAR